MGGSSIFARVARSVTSIVAPTRRNPFFAGAGAIKNELNKVGAAAGIGESRQQVTQQAAEGGTRERLKNRKGCSSGEA